MGTNLRRKVRDGKHIRHPRYEGPDQYPFCVLANRLTSLSLTDEKICDQSKYGDKRGKTR